MDGDKELSEWVQTILLNAEMEVLMELTTHYEQLAMKLEIGLAKIKTTLKHVEDTNNTVKVTYSDSDKERQLLEERLK